MKNEKSAHELARICTNYIFFFLLFSFFFFSCRPKAPVLTSIDPKIGRMGEVITLTGENFGDERNESFVTIAGIPPTSRSYYNWQNDSITVRVPELGDSGLVFVHVNGKKSNGLLFSNIASVPRPIEGEGLGSEPSIISVSPQSGAPGTLITVSGINFGQTREPGSGVFFSWDYAPSFNPFAVREPEFAEALDINLGYVSWSFREIKTRVPDGAVSGNLEVRTPNGRSRPIHFEVTGKPGNKSFSDKRSYTVSYSVDIRVLESTYPNALYLWMPVPSTTPSQKNVSLVSRNANPFLEKPPELDLYKLTNLAPGTNHSIKVSYKVDVFSIETSLRPTAITGAASPLSEYYTQSSNLIPSANSNVISTSGSITDKETNPYIKARKIYDWMINNIDISNSHSPGYIVNVIFQKRADPYAAALLYTALMRAAGIPCAPVAGVLVDDNRKTTCHYWAEFWIDNFGWVPVDPALGSGYTPQSFKTKSDPRNYYFGNIDNQRITFSWGEQTLARTDVTGRYVTRNQSYSLQNIWEEFAGGMESYTSFWSDIAISGVYAQ